MVGARDLLAEHGETRCWNGPARAAPQGALYGTWRTRRTVDDRLQPFEAITMRWERVTALGPVLVVMEDIHWADESTRHLLRFLAGR